MKYLTKQLRVRLPTNLLELIEFFAAYHDIDRSKAVRKLLNEGLMRTSSTGLLERLMTNLRKENPDPLVRMEICEKCKSIEDLSVYHIDGNIRNLNPYNLIVLCKPCRNSLKRYIQKYDPQVQFISWYAEL